VRAGVARRAVSDEIAPSATPASAAEAAMLTAPRKVRRDVFVLVPVSCVSMTHAEATAYR